MIHDGPKEAGRQAWRQVLGLAAQMRQQALGLAEGLRQLVLVGQGPLQHAQWRNQPRALEPVHLLLLDMHMPRLTGLETLQLLRQINALLPAILITGDANESLLRQACQAHVYSVIPKPVSKNVVLYTVVRALARSYGQPPPREG